MQELNIVEAVTVVEEAEVLDPLAARMRGIVDAILGRGAIREILHGVPAGHVIHPAVILVPVGAWISSAILDCVPGSEKSARILVGAGVLTVLPAVATGLTDWSELPQKRQQRVGVVHAASNTVATALYAASFVQRTRGKQASGRALGLVGLVFVGLSGYLGGHLAYRQGSSVEPSAVSVGAHAVGE